MRVASLSVLALGLIGCAHDRPLKPRPEPPKTVTVVRVPAGEAALHETVGEVEAVESDDVLDDAKILEVTRVANEGASEEAKLARYRAMDPQLRAMAEKIVKNNFEADRRAQRVARVAKVRHTDSSISTAMEQDWRQDIDQLADKDGRDFDRAFVDGQLEHQRLMLRLIDDELLPSASRPAVKNLVRSIRPEVVKRFDELRVLQQKLGK